MNIEAIGKSGHFKLIKSDDQWIRISQSKIVEVDAEEKVLGSWNLASGKAEEFVDVVHQTKPGLVQKKFKTTMNGSDNTTFELMITFNNTDTTIDYEDTFTSTPVSIKPYELKFSIKLENWSYADTSTNIHYEITMIDKTVSKLVEKDQESDDTIIEVPSGTMSAISTFHTDKEGGDTINNGVETSIEGTNTIKFAFDVASKPRVIAYDPTISLYGETRPITCNCDSYPYEPVMNTVTGTRYDNLCYAVCQGSEDPNNIIPVFHDNTGSRPVNYMIIGSIVFIVCLVFLLIYLMYF